MREKYLTDLVREAMKKVNIVRTNGEKFSQSIEKPLKQTAGNNFVAKVKESTSTQGTVECNFKIINFVISKMFSDRATAPHTH